MAVTLSPHGGAPDLEKLRNSGGPGAKDSPESLRATAQEFEAMLVGQMLKMMREGSGGEGGWMGTSMDSGNEGLMDMAEQQIARAIAQRGGFGLGTLITQGLQQQHAKGEAPPKP